MYTWQNSTRDSFANLSKLQTLNKNQLWGQPD